MKLAALGEVMLEFAPQADGSHVQSFAGDTYNTAVYIARAGVDVHYVTLLGDDPYSGQLLEQMRGEGIGTGAIERLPGRSPGLYLIRNSADGERQFTYWRGEAPARELFADPARRERLRQRLADMDCLYLSGITLAIMRPEARAALLDFVRELRARGGRLAFDSNYRPRLWQSAEETRAAFGAFLEQADMALLTLEDEQLLWGDADAEACLARCGRYAVAELVLKRGAEPVLLRYNGSRASVDVPPVAGIVDTTGAGDSFNAGYLAARLKGEAPEQAVAAGNRLAAKVICHRGAIIPRTLFTDICTS